MDSLISVIITTYKRPQSLKKCIEAIFQQTYQHFEILVISDGYDSSVQIIIDSFLSSRLTYYFTDSHIGRPAPLRNIGIDNAKGDFIAFCDDDDYWCATKLEDQIFVIKKYNIDFCCTNASICQDNTITGHLNRNFAYKISYHSILIRSSIILSSVLVRKTYLERVRFKEEVVYKSWEDFFLWIELFYSSKDMIPRFAYLKKPLLIYTLSNDSIRKKSQKLKFLIILVIVTKYLFLNRRYYSMIIFMCAQSLRTLSEIVRLRTIFSRV